MTQPPIHDFGTVDEKGDTFEFYYNTGKAAECRLEAVIQTERGPRRSELAAVSTALWRKVSVRAVRELIFGMGEEERTRKKPTLKTGINRLGPLLGRELAVLLWVLMEKGAEERVETILHGWRELAREERWWLFSRGSAPGQGPGIGWRRALFHALSEPGDSRSVSADSAQKKSLPISPIPSRGSQTKSGTKAGGNGKASSMKRQRKTKQPKKKPLPVAGAKQRKRKAMTTSLSS